MKNLKTVISEMTGLVEAFKARQNEAAERIITLGSELQAEREAMNAAVLADDSAAYAEHEARSRYCAARIEDAKKVQIAPLFASREEALALDRAYRQAVQEAAAPLYARLLKTCEEQETILSALMEVKKAAAFPGGIGKAMMEKGILASSFSVHPDLAKNIAALKLTVGRMNK